MRLRIVSLVVLSTVVGCSGPKPAPAIEQARGTARIAIGQLPEIDTEAVLGHTRVLASDDFEGRAPGTRGEERTVQYLVDQLKKMGLKPGNTDGTYVQKVP